MWRELKGTLNVMKSYVDILKGNTVLKHQTDNQNVVRAPSTGSKKDNLHAPVITIFKLCIENDIHVYPLISKYIDQDDYVLHLELFAALDILWGPHTIDGFSSYRPRIVLQFVAPFVAPK